MLKLNLLICTCSDQKWTEEVVVSHRDCQGKFFKQGAGYIPSTTHEHSVCTTHSIKEFRYVPGERYQIQGSTLRAYNNFKS